MVAGGSESLSHVSLRVGWQRGRETRVTYHLDLHECFIAVVEEITGLAAVDSDDAEQELATETEGERRIVGGDDGIDTVLQIVLQDLYLGDLALLVGGQPRLGQRTGGA